MSTTATILTSILDLIGIKPARPITGKKFNAAYARFARRNPQWQAALFDEQFLRSALRRKKSQGDDHLAPKEMAEAWAAQLHWGDQATRTARVVEATPVAAEFLRLIADQS